LPLLWIKPQFVQPSMQSYAQSQFFYEDLWHHKDLILQSSYHICGSVTYASYGLRQVWQN
jgi:hypothetical protein